MSDALIVGLISLSGSLIVALISLAGVLFTLSRNQRQHDNSIAAERQKSREEKEFAAKQKSLMRATECTVKFLHYLVSLPVRELPANGETDPALQEIGAAFFELHFYCSVETIKEVNKLNVILTKAALDVSTIKTDSVLLISFIKAIESRIDSVEKRYDIVSAEIASILKTDAKSPLVSFYIKELGKHEKELVELRNHKSDLMKSNYRAVESCRDELIKHLGSIADGVATIMVLARKELNFPVDEKLYLAMMKEMTQTQFENMNSAITAIRNKILSAINSPPISKS